MSILSATESSKSATSWRLGTRATNALNGFFLFNLFDDAVADLLCLRTTTHGTSPKCYSSIMRSGADPARGGTGGESGLYAAFGRTHTFETEKKASGWNCKNRFFVFLHDCPEPIKRWQPRVYSIAASIGENCSPEQSKLAKAKSVALSLFEGFCSPALKFRFTPESSIKFQWDQTFSDKKQIAGFTEQPISPDHIGLYGSLKQGVNRQWGARIRANPAQFVKGLLKLIATVTLLALAIFAAIHYPLAATLVRLYLAVKGSLVINRFFCPLAHAPS
jgi:hypothetical protein